MVAAACPLHRLNPMPAMPAAEEYGAKARFPVCEVDQVDALVVGRAGGERRPEATLDSTRVGCAMKMVACARRLEVLSEQPRLQGVSLEGVVRRVDNQLWCEKMLSFARARSRSSIGM